MKLDKVTLREMEKVARKFGIPTDRVYGACKELIGPNKYGWSGALESIRQRLEDTGQPEPLELPTCVNCRGTKDSPQFGCMSHFHYGDTVFGWERLPSKSELPTVPTSDKPSLKDGYYPKKVDGWDVFISSGKPCSCNKEGCCDDCFDDDTCGCCQERIPENSEKWELWGKGYKLKAVRCSKCVALPNLCKCGKRPVSVVGSHNLEHWGWGIECSCGKQSTLWENFDEALVSWNKGGRDGAKVPPLSGRRYGVSMVESYVKMKDEDYKTFLSPSHRDMIAQGLLLAERHRELWSREDKERGDAAIQAVTELLEGSGTREAVMVAEKRARAACRKYTQRLGNPNWPGNYFPQKWAIFLVASVARLAAAEYKNPQERRLGAVLDLDEIISSTPLKESHGRV